jgi:hypothetical protein
MINRHCDLSRVDLPPDLTFIAEPPVNAPKPMEPSLSPAITASSKHRRKRSPAAVKRDPAGLGEGLQPGSLKEIGPKRDASY